MTARGPDPDESEIRLMHGAAAAAIRLVGAEPVAWSVNGRDLLWGGDPQWWAHCAPILFPIVGRLRGGRVRIGDGVHAMGVHGFARGMPFTVVDRAADHVRLRLAQNAETRAAYPFPFSLTVDYRLTDATLSAVFDVSNPGDEPLPYALGFHPGFRWPFAGGRPEEYAVVFADEEQAEVPVITADGLFSSRQRPVPFDGKRLPLSHELMSNEALCFLDARSTEARFVAPDGTSIGVAVEDFPHLALWSRPPAPFLCIESWTGFGDADDFAGDITTKPSMRMLAPGGEARHAAHLSFAEARS
jgi:galactose mutarotase-like enzyme